MRCIKFFFILATFSLNANATNNPIKACINYLTPKLKDHVVDRYRADFSEKELKLNDRHKNSKFPISIKLGRPLGSGMFASVYEIHELGDPRIPSELLSDLKLVLKVPHIFKYQIPAYAFGLSENEIQNEFEIYKSVVARFPNLKLPVIPILARYKTEMGTLLVKMRAKGRTLKQLAADFQNEELPIEMVKGLEDVFAFSQTLYHNFKKLVWKFDLNRRINKALSLKPFWEGTEEGFALDIRPDNLVWIDDPKTLNAIGLDSTKPQWALFELSQIPLNLPYFQTGKDSDSVAKFQKDYIELVLQYVERYRRLVKKTL